MTTTHIRAAHECPVDILELSRKLADKVEAAHVESAAAFDDLKQRVEVPKHHADSVDRDGADEALDNGGGSHRALVLRPFGFGDAQTALHLLERVSQALADLSEFITSHAGDATDGGESA
jgi:hypothetical protein